MGPISPQFACHDEHGREIAMITLCVHAVSAWNSGGHPIFYLFPVLQIPS